MEKGLYANRPLTSGHPELARRAVAAFSATQDAGDSRAEDIRSMVTCLSRLRPLPPASRVVVVGCGPKPLTATELAAMQYEVTAVEPVEGFADAARTFVAGRAVVITGTAEKMPIPDESQDVVVCESILEHVESPRLALSEVYRLLKPGGVAWLVTTNKWRFSVLGHNGEYNVPFFNWLPPVLQEAYVFQHLHHKPSLANYSLRPAVHWFTYAALCQAGRDVGFSRFYSIVDLVSPQDPQIANSVFRRTVLRLISASPWIRAFALTQIGGLIVMVKT
jgi:ubiquinone/menaquinone biosynthesis C-methylase UbiE